MKTIKKFCRMALVLALACSLATTLSQLALPLNAQDIYVDSLSGTLAYTLLPGRRSICALLPPAYFSLVPLCFRGTTSLS